jgi:hypothetical protein
MKAKFNLNKSKEDLQWLCDFKWFYKEVYIEIYTDIMCKIFSLWRIFDKWMINFWWNQMWINIITVISFNLLQFEAKTYLWSLIHRFMRMYWCAYENMYAYADMNVYEIFM